MDTDTISATLMKMRLEAVRSSVVDAAGRWGLKFPPHDGVKFYTVRKGECWLWLQGDRKTHHLRAGDCILLSRGKAFVLAASLSLQNPVPLGTALNSIKNGVMTLGGGGEFLLLGVAFQFEGLLPKAIFGRLPSVIHIRGSSDQSVALRWNLDRYADEFHGRQIGRALMLNQLAPVIFLQILRVYLSGASDARNWFTALTDPDLSKAIEAMHTDCGRRWTLRSLARVAGISRSTFALNFKNRIGLSPMEYLAQWRMQTACELLEAGEKSMTEIANAVGYESESAFSAAFNRIVRHRPGFYQKNFARMRGLTQRD